MPADLFLILCVALTPLLLILNFCVYKIGQYRGWRQSLRIQNEVVALKEGETFFGVVDQGKGHYFFIGRDISNGKSYE